MEDLIARDRSILLQNGGGSTRYFVPKNENMRIEIWAKMRIHKIGG